MRVCKVEEKEPKDERLNDEVEPAVEENDRMHRKMCWEEGRDIER